MKAYLMFADRDFDPDQKLAELGRPSYARRGAEFDPWKLLPWGSRELVQDLEPDTLFKAMAAGDEFLLAVSRHAVLSAVRQDRGTVLYRQEVLKDCLANPETIRAMHALAIEAIEGERKKGGWWSRDFPSGMLGHAVEVLQFFTGMLKKLRSIADENAEKFSSAGLSRLFSMLQAELGDDYFAEISDHLRELQLRNGVLISAALGPASKGIDYVLRRPTEHDRGWLNRLFTPGPPSYTLYIAPRDEAGARDLSDLRDRGVSLVANALARATDHILSFFVMLRTELAFYVSCLNLKEQLEKLGEPFCFPDPHPPGERTFRCRELYDVCLALSSGKGVVGNDIDADGRDLIVVTGANQGGKSTFLRSAGLSQVMMQAGMFVAAEAHAADMADGIFTHYKREEDTSMNSGKLDEELARMSGIIDHLRPNALVLFNESFAATNEREGSEIGRQILAALIRKHVKLLFVTHLFDLASSLQQEGKREYFFLRAERDEAGKRPFKLREGEPLRTSFGEDLYRRIFKTAA
jgi:hypothetical protein